MSKRYGDRDALCGVDLVARPGGLHGLLGPNGAGKTTLMRVLLGLVRRDAGTVRLLGGDLRLDGRTAARRGCRLRRDPRLLSLPVRAAEPRAARPSRRRCQDPAGSDKVGRALEQVGLAAHADVAVAGYSAGMRQRLGLAAALLRTPRLLFLDEPTSSLDPGGARDVRALARRLADEGAAVVLSSHDMAEVEELCTVLTVINHGRVVFAGTVDELRTLAPAAVHALRTSDDRAALDLAIAAARSEGEDRAPARRRSRGVGRHRRARRLRHRARTRRRRRPRARAPRALARVAVPRAHGHADAATRRRAGVA